MPDGWVIDPDGAYVNDLARYKEDPENTGVLPLRGDAVWSQRLRTGYDGELLVGSLSHAGCTTAASGTGGGVMIFAIKIDDFIDLASYEDEVEALAEWVCSARPLPDFDKIYTPGDIEQETYARLCIDGIGLPNPTWKAIGEIAKELNVEMPVL